MATKADFNAEEWQAISEAPALAGLAVSTAEKGGRIREAIAMGGAWAEGQAADGDAGLVGEIAKDVPRIAPGRFNSPEELRSEAIDVVSRAVRLVEEKSAGDLDAYRRFIVTIAERAAAADKTGGFLGIGGVEVSDAEQVALDQIRAAAGADGLAGA